MRTLLSLFLVVGLANAAYAVPGDLDTTFSGDGYESNRFVTGSPGSTESSGTAPGKVTRET